MVQVTSLAFSPDGDQLSSADEDGVIITWDLAEAKKLASAAKHAGAVWSLAYSQGDGGLLASGKNRTLEHAARYFMFGGPTQSEQGHWLQDTGNMDYWKRKTENKMVNLAFCWRLKC